MSDGDDGDVDDNDSENDSSGHSDDGVDEGIILRKVDSCRTFFELLVALKSEFLVSARTYSSVLVQTQSQRIRAQSPGPRVGGLPASSGAHGRPPGGGLQGPGVQGPRAPRKVQVDVGSQER